eukprot:768679-Hanusia_phi.AAC.6
MGKREGEGARGSARARAGEGWRRDGRMVARGERREEREEWTGCGAEKTGGRNIRGKSPHVRTMRGYERLMMLRRNRSEGSDMEEGMIRKGAAGKDEEEGIDQRRGGDRSAKRRG